ncbi:hypothetical protein [Paenibacillus elgii]|uniref:hypothetical protein n=1 Tax=Paenibacillus elgii TaxID=189691 RepID=UPI000248D3AB|nr:hypothetical protein [Paenibacillus elgii]
MVKINFLDGTELVIHEDTVLNGYKSSEGISYYLERHSRDSINGFFNKEGSPLATVNPMVGVMGFILSFDCFSVGLDTENNVLYLPSSVKSVENL